MEPSPNEIATNPAIPRQLSSLQMQHDDIRRLAVLQFEGMEAIIELDDGSKIRGLIVSTKTTTTVSANSVVSSLELSVRATDTNEVTVLSAEMIKSVWLCSNGAVETYYSRSSGR